MNKFPLFSFSELFINNSPLFVTFVKKKERTYRPSPAALLSLFTAFAAPAANQIKSVFCRGVYVTENTARPASVPAQRVHAAPRKHYFFSRWLKK